MLAAGSVGEFCGVDEEGLVGVAEVSGEELPGSTGDVEAVGSFGEGGIGGEWLGVFCA